MIVVAYSVALLSTSVYASLYAGRAGRAASAIIIVLFTASAITARIAPSAEWLVPRMFAIDLLSLILKVCLALLSRRRWPIVIAAFQLNTVCAQAAIILSPSFRTEVHYAMATVWAAPTLLVIIIGTYLDLRADRRVAR